MPNLVLIPTEFERRPIEAALQLDSSRWSIQTIGFGVIAAGIETSKAIAQHRPERVILAGIAGLFARHQSKALTIGDAIWFDTVGIDGIGIGQGDAFIDAIDLGWNWHPSKQESGVIRCHNSSSVKNRMLLTVCSGSADDVDAQRREHRYPDAIGEDMESFSVAMACQSAKIELSIVRGLSNLVGCRDKSDWCVDKALDSVASELQKAVDEVDQ